MKGHVSLQTFRRFPCGFWITQAFHVVLCLTVVHTPVENIVGNALVVASGSGASKHAFEVPNRDFWLPGQM